MQNQHGPDLPMGFGMQLMQHPAAMHHYGQLRNVEKERLIGYIQSSTTGPEAKNRIAETVSRLGQGYNTF